MASLHLQILLPLGSTWRFFIFTTFNIVSIIIFVLVPPASSYSVTRSLLQSGGTPPLVFLPNSALQQGAVCLDGSIPAYIFDQGSGSGQNNWIVHLEGGGWCSSSSDCLQRSTTDLGSSKYMSAYGLGGYLSRSPTVNPDFYNWNRVLVRYCDGGSFSGNAAAPLQFVGQDGQMHTLYFRGQKVWEAVMDDLLSKGMMNAGKAIHSGDSAGSLAAFHHCNRFRERMPAQAEVKCLCDAGFFMDVPNIAGQYSFRSFFHDVVALHSITLLPSGCTSKMDPGQCFFPQYSLEYINVPLFILQSPYDSFQVQYILAPPGSYANGLWDACRQNLASCSSSQLATLQDFRGKMLAALQPIVGKNNWGLFAISCYYHTLSEYDAIWNGTPKVNNMNIEAAFRMWFFGGALVQKIDCAYPCNPTCVNVS